MRAQRGRNKIPAQGDKYIRRSRSAKTGVRWVAITIENVIRSETDVTIVYRNDSDGAQGNVSYSTFARMSDYRPAETVCAGFVDAPRAPNAPMIATADHRLELARALAWGVVASLAAGNTQCAQAALEGLRRLVDAQEGAKQVVIGNTATLGSLTGASSLTTLQTGASVVHPSTTKQEGN